MNAKTKEEARAYVKAVQTAFHALTVDAFMVIPPWYRQVEIAGERFLKQIELDDTYEKANRPAPATAPAPAPGAPAPGVPS